MGRGLRMVDGKGEDSIEPLAERKKIKKKSVKQ